MKSAWLVLNLGLSTALGLWFAWRFFVQRRPNPPLLTSLHLVLGAIALIGLAMLRRGAPDGTVMAPGPLADTTGLLLVGAMATGLLASLVGRQWGRRPGARVLWVHLAAGLGGFGLLLWWVAGT